MPPQSPVSRWSTLSQRKTWFLQTMKGWDLGCPPCPTPGDAPGAVAAEAAVQLGVPVAGWRGESCWGNHQDGLRGGTHRYRFRCGHRRRQWSIRRRTPWRLHSGINRPQPGATQRQAFPIHGARMAWVEGRVGPWAGPQHRGSG